MGRIRTTWMKTVSKELVEKHPDRFTTSFEENKKVLNELNLFDSKLIRNRIAGYIVKVIKKKKF